MILVVRPIERVPMPNRPTGLIGDGLMAIFGIDDQPEAPLRAVNAALQTLATVDRLKPFFASMYGIDFDIRIGLNYGEAVIGTLGFAGHERLTAIGDVVNLASRIESANKDAGTRLLISEALRDQIAERVEIGDFVRVRLRGTGERTSLFEIIRLKPEIDAELNAKGPRETMRHGGRRWVRAFAEDELQPHERRILDFEDYDIVVVRGSDSYCAFNKCLPASSFATLRTSKLRSGRSAQSPTHGEHDHWRSWPSLPLASELF